MFMYLCDESTCLASDLELILIHDPLTDSAVFQWNAKYHTCKTY